MDNNKIIRTVCHFTDNPNPESLARIEQVVNKLNERGFSIQTKRICAHTKIKVLDEAILDSSIYCSVGTLSKSEAVGQLADFFKAKNMAFNIELGGEKITESDADLLFQIIRDKAEKTFSFTYVSNNAPSSPFFPSASYNGNGFAIGLQPTDLSVNSHSLEDWFGKMKDTWVEISEVFQNDELFLGIDSSIAPLFQGKSSLINFVKRLGLDFSQSVITDTYLKITKFIKEENPKPVGLCGLMFPCLEDFELADEYEKGNFSLERNVYLSLHSGLGIDTYPIGIDETPEKVTRILSLIQGLSNKYKKPLSVRFVSDGKTKVGEKTDFKNQFLKDVRIRPL